MFQLSSAVNIKSRDGETLKKEIASFLKANDYQFMPPLSERVEIEEWTQKLFKEAVIDLAWSENTLVGISFYYSTPDEFPYARHVGICVDESQKGRGIGAALIQQCICCCQKRGSVGIESQTWESNNVSRSLFEKFGFEEIDYVHNRNNKELSVLLRLHFDE